MGLESIESRINLAAENTLFTLVELPRITRERWQTHQYEFIIAAVVILIVIGLLSGLQTAELPKIELPPELPSSAR